MTAALTLPISPAQREFVIHVDDQPLSQVHQVLGVSVSLVVNRIGSARIVFADGSAAASNFPLAGSDTLNVGKQVEIFVRDGKRVDSIFKGIIVRHQIKLRTESDAQLIVDCRHAAMKLAIQRTRSAHFGVRDSDVISRLLKAHGIPANVGKTKIVHEQLVQYDLTDWEFLLARAQDNGLWVWSTPDELVVKRPPPDGEPVCDLYYGSTLMDLDAEYDARDQFSTARVAHWDAGLQTVATANAARSPLAELGSLSTAELAAVGGVGAEELRVTSIETAEAQTLADTTYERTRHLKLKGRAMCEGIAAVRPGTFVRLAGLGRRFEGKALVTGVRHEYGTKRGWKTHLQFGGIDDDARASVGRRTRGATLDVPPRVSGLQIGVVVSNEDPSGEWRVRVHLPLVPGSDNGIWVRAASLDAGPQRGLFFRPEIGDEVVVGFFDADPRQGLLLGMLHSSAKAAPFAATNANPRKGYVSRSGLRLEFDDAAQKLQISTPGGKTVTLRDGGPLELADEHDNRIVMNDKGIVIESASALTLRAGTEIELKAGTSLLAKGETTASVEAGTRAELSGTALTVVKGALVQIN